MNGKIYCLPIVPTSFRSIKPLGCDKTFEKLCEYYWCQRTIIFCQVSDSSSSKILAELHQIQEYAIVLIDAFTKYLHLYHTLNIDSCNMTNALNY